MQIWDKEFDPSTLELTPREQIERAHQRIELLWSCLASFRMEADRQRRLSERRDVVLAITILVVAAVIILAMPLP